jgi:membrane protease YdiL (CAAX protease family)
MPWDFWLIFLFLGVVVPWRGYVQLKKLLALPAIDTKERLALYGWTIAFQWVITGLVAWRALARGLTAVELGLARNGGPRLLFASVAGAVALGGIHWLNLRRVGSMSSSVSEQMRTLARRILPRTTVELLAYCALAVTAGVCEEFLYRGFAMAAAFRFGIGAWAVVLLTSISFGFAHIYQGRGGIAGTTLMGLLFGTLRIAYDTLILVMILHTTVDLVAGIAGPRYLLKEFDQK